MAYDYDISSSYPSVMANLLDLRYGYWVQGKEIPADAYYGFAYGKVAITSEVSPVLFHAADGYYYSPKGVWETALPLQIIRLIEDYYLGHYEIQEGHWWVPKKKVYPLQLIMHKLFRDRSQSLLLKKTVKKAMVVQYGKTLEVHKDGTFGDRFNPVWGAIIEAEINVKVFKFCYQAIINGVKIMHISTDGVLTDKPMPEDALAFLNGKKVSGQMGTWRLDSTGPALVVSSGVLFYGDKRPNQINYQEAMAMIADNPDGYEWGKRFQRRMTLGDLIENHLPIGTMQTVSTSFGLSSQHDREFKKIPTSGRELLDNVYESTALPVTRLRAYKE